MNVLVIGAAGYIGSHVCLRLTEAGHQVVALDNFSTGHRQAVLWGDLVEASLEDREVVVGILRQHKIDAVMHLAANSLVAESISNPLAYYQANVAATIALLMAMRDANARHFIFSSSAAVFGEPRHDRIAEDHPRQPINPYGNSKLVAELVLEDAVRAHGFHVTSLRYFNAAGADPMGRIGESHNPETHLIPRLLRKANGEVSDVKIFGMDYPTRDGSCVRDYIHVLDIADAHLLAMEFNRAEAGFHCFNLGNGGGYSVLEVVQAAERVVGRPLELSQGPRRPGDPAMLVASGQKAAQVLGWKPRCSDLDRILADAWRWHRQPRY